MSLKAFYSILVKENEVSIPGVVCCDFSCSCDRWQGNEYNVTGQRHNERGVTQATHRGNLWLIAIAKFEQEGY